MISRMIPPMTSLVNGLNRIVSSRREAVRRKPYSVVLFDEIEKAHPDVFNVLLQVLDDGRITDSQGRTVDFKNTILIMTSNIGADYLLDGIDGDGNIKEESESMVMNDLRSHFRPEFLNRLDETILFKPLTKEVIGGIIRLIIDDLNERLSDRELTIVFLHIFAHIDTNHVILIIKQRSRQRFGQFRFPDAGRPQKQE